MSVTSTALLRAQPTGTVSVGGVKEYQTVHRVKTNALTDGIVVVAAAIGTPGTTTYSAGGETDASAVLKTIAPKREAEKSLWWNVTSDWGPLDDKDESKTGRKEPGQPSIPKPEVLGDATDNPLEFADTVEMDVMWKQTEMWEAEFRGGANGAGVGPQLVVGQKYAIQNSAGEIRDPPDMEEYPVPVYRFVLHRETLDTAKAMKFTNAINEGQWTWDSVLWGVHITAAPGTAWCQSWTGGLSFMNGIRVARITVSIAIDPEGWNIRFPDMGYRRKFDAQYDEPPFMNANGGPMGQPPEIGTKWVEMKDVYGEPIRQPAALDGFGQPLGENQQTRYLEWLSVRKKRVSFAGILSR